MCVSFCFLIEVPHHYCVMALLFHDHISGIVRGYSCYAVFHFCVYVEGYACLPVGCIIVVQWVATLKSGQTFLFSWDYHSHFMLVYFSSSSSSCTCSSFSNVLTLYVVIFSRSPLVWGFFLTQRFLAPPEYNFGRLEPTKLNSLASLIHSTYLDGDIINATDTCTACA